MRGFALFGDHKERIACVCVCWPNLFALLAKCAEHFFVGQYEIIQNGK